MLIQAREELREKQIADRLSTGLKSNQYDFLHMNSREFIDYAVNAKRLSGMHVDKIANWVKSFVPESEKVKKYWVENSTDTKTFLGLVPLFLDALDLKALAMDMKKSGGFFSQFQIKVYAGKEYIIFQGYPGLRKHLTGSRYLANNPKLVSFGIGKLGARNSIKSGFIVTILISAGFQTIELLLNDQKTWYDFIGGLSVDVAIAVASSGIAWSAVTAVVGVSATVAIGPMIAIVVVGSLLVTATSLYLDTDSLSNQIAIALRLAVKKMNNDLQAAKSEISRAQRWYEEDPVGFMRRLFGLPTFGRYYER